MQRDIIEYHLIQLVPECFLLATPWARAVALDVMAKRRFVRDCREFWHTVRVLGCCLHKLAAFIDINTTDSWPRDDPRSDYGVLATYTIAEHRYIINTMLVIPHNTLDKLYSLYKYLSMRFSVWYAHLLHDCLTYLEIDHTISAVLRHFPHIITYYLSSMSDMYTSRWEQHQYIITHAIDTIIEDYPQLCNKKLFAKLRHRVRNKIWF